jgi:hypothetical protein
MLYTERQLFQGLVRMRTVRRRSLRGGQDDED